ncbi:hypothetical protein RYV96_003253, partial [Salmonella enterica subsp. enterica serovar Rubislaw]|nr:hypothetical protein [Salmonella enterica subsp. enterica serovar Rubislaw]
DGLALRLPTICVRPGKPNRAASSFVSAIIREPLQGETTICPVSESLRLWISSPATVIHNLSLAATLPAPGEASSINLPGISVTVGEMLETLRQAGGQAARDRVTHQRDEGVEKIVASWPGRIDNQRALALGFVADKRFDDIIERFRQDDMEGRS